jgi:hypothetical protein
MKGRALLAALLATAAVAHAQKQTVCTVTVNSPDEREVFRRYLPEDRFDFVELVERGRPDWLRASCEKHVQCDVLVVSGHFAGTEFYSSRFDSTETLPVDEIERAQCSDSCPGLFSKLKEVYLFGCDTLNPTPIRTATPEVAMSLVREGATPDAAKRQAQALADRYGESALAHMRRLFPNVPVIYGFSSKAPYGRIAGPMLERYFQTGGEVGTGQVSERLHKLFAPASMTVTSGLREGDSNADYRAEACRYHDDRLTPAMKLAAIRETMARSMAEARLSLEPIEKFFATLPAKARNEPTFRDAIGSLATDGALRSRYVSLVRDAPDPAVRVRLIALGGEIGWFTQADRREEQMRMVADVLTRGGADFGEVDLICSLNADRSLDAERAWLSGVALPAGRAADAALACLGDDAGRSRTLQALASREERDVQIVQAYLRHRPITDADELRKVAMKVAGMDAGGAQARALEALARLRIEDEQVLLALRQLGERTRSPAVKRAVSEVFLRAGRL